MKTMGFRKPYESLPFNEAEYTRSLQEVCDMHRIDFPGLVAGKLAEQGSCAVLDVGSGSSTFGWELAVLFPDAVVCTTDLYSDDERGGMDRTGAPPNLAFVQADGERLPFFDASFDIMVFTYSNSAYDLGERTAETNYIAEIGRLLRPGGFASVRPETRFFAAFQPELIQGDSRFEQDTRLRAQAYLALQQAGLAVTFPDQPTRARIFKF